MLDPLITSKTRFKLLMKFFLNSNSSSYLRELESEFRESTNAIRLELNRFEKAGLLESHMSGNKKFYRANLSHPLFPDINNILKKYVGYDKIIENIINKLGDLKSVYIVGEFARGNDDHILDLVFVSDEVDGEYLSGLVQKAEKLIRRRIRYLVLQPNEFKQYLKNLKSSEVLLLWQG
jgi:predicted nucleotidyltransferase